MQSGTDHMCEETYGAGLETMLTLRYVQARKRKAALLSHQSKCARQQNNPGLRGREAPGVRQPWGLYDVSEGNCHQSIL